LLIILYNYRL